ncbi:lysylphosphatidylglycerol synthase domain-containing protein [Methylorubrum zatmanii]|uniref:Lysylphosphatidylglycerol synthase domain-containing protein n=1 Tax=Methylorubrum zatmanii TaxID=29429 RepID=A0ABW1WUA2_9HYPH|nr:lysylphosphatidylglycerol synthase domain-containing protein [Methylorubrum zatmanii]MBD8906078.1 TIGR00374 family protein [Methylorubrum zatmanii]
MAEAPIRETAPAGRPAAQRSGHGVLRGLLRRLPLIGTLGGLALGVWLVATNDLSAVGAAFGRIGPLGLVAIVLVRALIILLCGLAWARVLDGLPPSGRAPGGGASSPEPSVETGAFLILRFVREGVNVLLPVASVGGEVVGGRLLTFWGVAGGLAAASLLADMLIQVATQVAFTLLGAGLLWRLPGEAAAALARWTTEAAALAVAAVTAFFALQTLGAARGLERRLAGLGRRLLRSATPEAASASPGGLPVQDALDVVWARDRRRFIAQSVGLHAAAWTLGAAEIWIVLACIGIEVSLTEVLVLESLSQAIKSAAFPVPSGLGVQEGGFMVVGALFGLDAGIAIALSLAKRVPDVVLGLPSLIVWQTLEARRAQVLAPRD